MMMKYKRDHFENSCGAKRSLKPESKEAITKAKIRSVDKMLCWLVDDTGRTGVADLLKRVNLLGRDETGYFAVYWKVSSCKGDFHILPLAFLISSDFHFLIVYPPLVFMNPLFSSSFFHTIFFYFS